MRLIYVPWLYTIPPVCYLIEWRNGFEQCRTIEKMALVALALDIQCLVSERCDAPKRPTLAQICLAVTTGANMNHKNEIEEEALKS